MRILHVLDHSLPLHSGYTFRTRAIVKAQLARGWEVACLTGPRHAAGGPGSGGDRRHHFLSHAEARGRARAAWRMARDPGACRRGSTRWCAEWRPDQLHAHSPVLTALGALPVATPARPAAASTRSAPSGRMRRSATAPGREGSPRYRLTRAARNPCRAPGRCGGGDLRGAAARSVARGIAADKIFVSPNGVDMDLFGSPPPRRRGVRCRASGSTVRTWSASSAPSTIMRGWTI